MNEGREKSTGFVPRIGKMIDLRLYDELMRLAVKRELRRVDKGKGEG